MPDVGPIYLLDGSSLVFRAFFALPEDLATSSGTVTNAVHGFTSMLITLLRDHGPGGMAVAFDRPAPTFRDEIVPDYKGNRPAVPDLLRPQFDLVRAVLDALGIVRVDLERYEADDILATLATAARDAGRDAVVVTGDRDCFQLVEDPHVTVLYTRRGLSDTVRYDEAGIEERYGVPPSRYPLLAALRGDPSDNLAGVPGVGDKTAAKLVTAYGSLDGIFEHVADLSPKLRASVGASEDLVRRNAQVIPLVRDVPLDVGIADLGLGRWDVEEARRIFAELEMNGAWQRLAPLLQAGGVHRGSPGDAGARREGDGSGVEPAGVVPHPAGIIVGRTEPSACSAIDRVAEGAAALALGGRWAGEPGRAPLLGLAVGCVRDSGVGDGGGDGADSAGLELGPVAWLPAEVLTPAGRVVERVAALVGPTGLPVLGHGVKELMRSLLPLGIDATRLRIDTAVAAFLLEPDRGRAGIGELARRWLSLDIPAEASGQQSLTGMDPTTGSAAVERAATDAAAEGAAEDGAGVDDVVAGSGDELAGVVGDELALVTALVGPIEHALQADGLQALHRDVERPLVRVLARMEVAGIGVDVGELRRIAEELAGECSTLEAEVQRWAGEEFNVNSTPQLRHVLFEVLGLTPGKKTKTGYSTDAQTLERLRDAHPIVGALLRYREVEKLRSTYGTPLIDEVAPDGRIHATFHQTVARTGRLSSDRPNLHNIPVRTPEGMVLRRAFVPAPGTRLLVADYDQIELRVIAHLSDDPGLLAAFAERRDVHRSTAARVFGVPEQDVTSAQRNRAKMVSYGLAYGMEAYGLAQRLAIPTEEARGILDAYFDAFPSVRAYMERTVAEARATGYTLTALGRRRPLPDLLSGNRGLRQAAERQAMNAGIQGLAADLFKLALVRIDDAVQAAALAARLVLQVHDEVLLEVPGDEEMQVGALVVDTMVGVGATVGLRVPLDVSVGWGDSWAGAKR